MHAVVYRGPGRKAWEEVPKPQVVDDTDAVVRVDAVTICGTDLHILKGDVPTVTDGRVLGHEAVGTVELVGAAVTCRRPAARTAPTQSAADELSCRWRGERHRWGRGRLPPVVPAHTVVVAAARPGPPPRPPRLNPPPTLCSTTVI